MAVGTSNGVLKVYPFLALQVIGQKVVFLSPCDQMLHVYAVLDTENISFHQPRSVHKFSARTVLLVMLLTYPSSAGSSPIFSLQLSLFMSISNNIFKL